MQKKFICQKVQQFWAVFQCLALPKDCQSFCEVKKNVIRFFQKKILFHMNYPNVPKMQKQTNIDSEGQKAKFNCPLKTSQIALRTLRFPPLIVSSCACLETWTTDTR